MIHEGKNVRRFREMLGYNQQALAYGLGEEWSQKKVSLLESKEKIEEEVLAEIATFLKVPEDAIRNFDEQAAIYNIQHNYEGSNQGAGQINSGHSNSGSYYECTFNPLDKLLETVDELKSLYEANKLLYERLLQSERDKVELSKSKD